MRPIVVGIDHSQSAEAAAFEAAQLATRLTAPIHLVCAIKRHSGKKAEGPGDFSWEQSGVDLAEQLLRDLKGRLPVDEQVATSAVVVGRPAAVIVDEAERVNAEFIVVGNRRTQGTGRLLGSVAGDVLRSAPCAVYVAHTT